MTDGSGVPQLIRIEYSVYGPLPTYRSAITDTPLLPQRPLRGETNPNGLRIHAGSGITRVSVPVHQC